ncbi:MAG: Nif3-like dinuclear metal center hexameric protein [Candidatus Hermodarchaeota archaeon]
MENEISPKIYNFNSEIYGIHYGKISNKKIIKRIMMTIDLNLESIHFAIKNKINLIISVHGLINKPIIKFNTELINKLTLLSKFPIHIFVLNKTFIAANGGISDAIMEALYLKLDKPFMIRNKNENFIPIGRICFPNKYPRNKKSLSLEDLIIRIKSNLDMDNISYVGDLSRSIEKICIIGGETLKIEYLRKLAKEGCDCVISGKIIHNIANYAKEIGISLIEISLYRCNMLALRKLYNFLSLKYPYEEFFFFNAKNPLKIYK